MTQDISKSRRLFLRGAVLSAAVIPVAGLGLKVSSKAFAQDMPHAEDGHALDYVNNAPDSNHERHEEGQQCQKCVFWAGDPQNGWGRCNHPQFSNVLVNANGWCSAFVSAG